MSMDFSSLIKEINPDSSPINPFQYHPREARMLTMDTLVLAVVKEVAGSEEEADADGDSEHPGSIPRARR